MNCRIQIHDHQHLTLFLRTSTNYTRMPQITSYYVKLPNLDLNKNTKPTQHIFTFTKNTNSRAKLTTQADNDVTSESMKTFFCSSPGKNPSRQPIPIISHQMKIIMFVFQSFHKFYSETETPGVLFPVVFNKLTLDGLFDTAPFFSTNETDLNKIKPLFDEAVP